MRALSNPSFAAVVVATLARRTKLNFPLSSPALAHAAGLVSLALIGPSVSGVRIAAAAVHSASDRAIEVIFPEHVTVRPRGSTDANQIYLFQPGQYGERPLWRRSERALAYERNLPGTVHMLARATLEEDGVRFHFRLKNQ